MKVTPWLDVPTLGAVVGVVKVKAPSTLAVPPLKLELANVCPEEMGDAIGATMIDESALFIVKEKAAEVAPLKFPSPANAADTV